MSYLFKTFVINSIFPTEAAGSMSVTWVTLNSTRDTIVEYGPDGLTLSVTGKQTAFQDGGDQKRVIYVHKALLTGLKPLQKYSTYALYCPFMNVVLLRDNA